MARDDYAVLVGIDTYPTLGNLGGPQNDAREFYNWLISPEGGDVPQSQAYLILSQDYPSSTVARDAQPTTEEVDRKFERLLDIAEEKGGRVGRRLYIFLAGHGFAPTLDETALLMANATRQRISHHIAGRQYAQWFRAAVFFDEIVLLMDCCRESYFAVVPRVPPWKAMQGNPAVKVLYLYGYATEEMSAARERLIDGKTKGLFTTSVLAGLRGGARDAAGRITTSSLVKFVRNHLPTLLPPDVHQDPRFDVIPDQEIVFVSEQAVKPLNVQIQLSARNRGRKLQIRDANFKLVNEAAPAGEVWEVQLAPGLYTVGAAGGEQKIFQVLGDGVVHVDF